VGLFYLSWYAQAWYDLKVIELTTAAYMPPPRRPRHPMVGVVIGTSDILRVCKVKIHQEKNDLGRI
jgi:hypothetical protein